MLGDVKGLSPFLHLQPISDPWNTLSTVPLKILSGTKRERGGRERGGSISKE